jgi:hypothetical protein
MLGSGFIRRAAPTLLAATQIAVATAADRGPGGIGMEKDVAVTLDRGDYRPKPLDDRTPLILRLEAVKPADGGRFNYQFHYIAFEPGTYKLSDYLIQPDGSPAPLAEDASIEVGSILIDSILPPDFNGELNAFGARPFPWFGGYRMMMGCAVVLWLCGLPALIWLGRKKKIAVEEEVIAPPPTYAERMRPFVEAAAAGELSTAGQAELERLMTGYWREKISRPGQRMAEALSSLKKHPEAGSLLRALEHWLHQPGGASRAEIERLLEPYRLPAIAVVEQEVVA